MVDEYKFTGYGPGVLEACAVTLTDSEKRVQFLLTGGRTVQGQTLAKCIEGKLLLFLIFYLYCPGGLDFKVVNWDSPEKLFPGGLLEYPEVAWTSSTRFLMMPISR